MASPYQNFDPNKDPYLARHPARTDLGGASDYYKGLGAGIAGLPADLLGIAAALGAAKTPVGQAVQPQRFPFTTEHIGQMLKANTGSPAFNAGAIGAPDPKDLAKLAASSKLAAILPMFHQTRRANVPSLLSEGFDSSKLGARKTETMFPDGVFLKSTDRDIGLGGAQLRANADVDNVVKFSDRGDLQRFLMDDEKLGRQWWEASQNVDRLDRDLAAKYDAIEKRMSGVSDEEYQALMDEADKLFEYGNAQMAAAAEKARKLSEQIFRNSGYDAVSVAEDAGSFGRKTDTMVVLNPKKVEFRR